MEAYYSDIPTVSQQNSNDFIMNFVLAAMILIPLIFIIKSKIEIRQFNDQLYENQ